MFLVYQNTALIQYIRNKILCFFAAIATVIFAIYYNKNIIISSLCGIKKKYQKITNKHI